jgi:DnaJ-class molecular chaperone
VSCVHGTPKIESLTSPTQAVADAYYVLSDPVRRKEYDVLLASRSRSSRTADPGASPSFFNSFFTGTGTSTERGPRPDANGVFGDVFEEMMRPEIEKRVPWWTYIGAIGGALLGFVIISASSERS